MVARGGQPGSGAVRSGLYASRCLSFGPCELLTLSSPFVFGGFGASGTGRGTERPTRTGGLVGSWWGGGPCPAREGDPEGGQAGPVDRGGAGVDIGGNPFLAPDAGFAATPGHAYVMGYLSFHLRPGARVGVLPCRVGLGRLVGLENGFSGVDRHGPPVRRCGASCSQRATAAVAVEGGPPGAVLTETDVYDVTGGTGQRRSSLCRNGHHGPGRERPGLSHRRSRRPPTWRGYPRSRTRSRPSPSA